MNPDPQTLTPAASGGRAASAAVREGRHSPCRFCGAALRTTFVDLGVAPPCQSQIAPDALDRMEAFYPLHAYVCDECFLVQLQEFVSPENIFTEYAYFSSYSSSWVEHARRYAAAAVGRFALGAHSRVVEIASNDGYLLQHFVAAGVPALGIEPAANVAEAARAKGVPTLSEFFGCASARRVLHDHGPADLLVGNNVLAHVPDLNDFVAGMKILLAPHGVITMEFPHLQRLMAEAQFDTIYHEHFSYFSFVVAERVFAHHGLKVFDVDELPTHGGSLRIYAQHSEDTTRKVEPRVAALRERERADGVLSIARYRGFEQQVQRIKRDLLAFLIDAKRRGQRVVGYGAPGKGNTLLNYCGIRTDFLDFTVDANPYKQGHYTPGTRIPIHAPEKIREARPDFVLILPWNLKDEITRQCAYVGDWAAASWCRFRSCASCERAAACHRVKPRRSARGSTQMKILVTGTEGYIGARLAPWLHARGHQVVGLDTGFYRDGCLYLDPLGAPVAPATRFADLRQVGPDTFEGIDAVIHLAELSNDPLGQNRPEITYQINHQGTLHIAAAAKRAGVRRFVYASSCSVYGLGSGEFLDESSPVNPQTAYARCKVWVERDLTPMADGDFSVVFLRNATAYGPSPRMRFDIVLNDLCALAFTTRKIAMISDGSPWRPIVHVEDICEAMRCAVEAPAQAVNREVFNVGATSQNFRVREIAQIVAAVFPGCQVSAGPPGQDNRSYRVSFEKIEHRLPGFEARWSAEQGAAELRRLFERIEFSSAMHEHRSFTRLKQLKYLLRTGQVDDDLFWSAR